jgi:hypothetical protein
MNALATAATQDCDTMYQATALSHFTWLRVKVTSLFEIPGEIWWCVATHDSCFVAFFASGAW